MLCDQASDRIILKSLPTASHVPLTTSILLHYIIGFVNTLGRDQPCPLLATALVYTTLPTLSYKASPLSMCKV